MDMVKARYLLTLAESGTVTAAAERLGITQPALSRQLRRFEEELDLELFARAGSTLVLTDAARALLPTCRRLLAEAARAGRAASPATAIGRAATGTRPPTCSGRDSTRAPARLVPRTSAASSTVSSVGSPLSSERTTSPTR